MFKIITFAILTLISTSGFSQTTDDFLEIYGKGVSLYLLGNFNESSLVLQKLKDKYDSKDQDLIYYLTHSYYRNEKNSNALELIAEYEKLNFPQDTKSKEMLNLKRLIFEDEIRIKSESIAREKRLIEQRKLDVEKREKLDQNIELNWANAQKINNIKTYTEFVTNYPNSGYSVQAKSQIKVLEIKEAKRKKRRKNSWIYKQILLYSVGGALGLLLL